MKYLIDTDRVVDYLKGKNVTVQLLEDLIPDGIAISIISYGEILEGILFGEARIKQETGFKDFLRIATVLGLNRKIMRRFAELRGDLRHQGFLIPDPDLLIAATALHHGLAVVTGNIKHFSRIHSLQIHNSP